MARKIKKFEQPNEINQREKTIKLFIIMHCPEHRLFIREELRKREIEIFNTEYIRLIWETITSIEINKFGSNYLDDLRKPNRKSEL